MKFVINSTTYTQIDGLNFSPQTDLTNNSMPINEFEARIFTNAEITFGQWADLKDDNNNLWAHFWLRYAERVGRDDDRQTYIVKIIGQSPIAFLERVILPAEFIDNDAYSVIGDILDYVGNMGQESEIIDDNVIAGEFEDIDLYGFVPEQTARDRLLWVLLAAGGYVRSYFDTTIHICKIPTAVSAVIPIEKTFWKPTVKHRDYVTKISVTAYDYTQGTPTATDEYVTDGTDYWIQTKTVISVTNSNAPAGAPENEVKIDGVTLIDSDLAGAALVNLATYYFNRSEIDADVINNGEYTPGDKVTVHTDEDQLYTGFIDNTSYRFGLQARSTIHLIATQNVEGATLTINYMWDTECVSTRKIFLPKGYEYEINTEYIDQTRGDHRYIFRPTTATVTGTITQDTTQTVTVLPALDAYSNPSQTVETNTVLKDTVESMINQLAATDTAMIEASYRNDKKNREKYLKEVQKSMNADLTAMNAAFAAMGEGVIDTEFDLHIISVDEVDYEEETVVDPNDRTVVIS